MIKGATFNVGPYDLSIVKLMRLQFIVLFLVS